MDDHHSSNWSRNSSRTRRPAPLSSKMPTTSVHDIPTEPHHVDLVLQVHVRTPCDHLLRTIELAAYGYRNDAQLRDRRTKLHQPCPGIALQRTLVRRRLQEYRI